MHWSFAEVAADVGDVPAVDQASSGHPERSAET